jgi:hypothetical protein
LVPIHGYGNVLVETQALVDSKEFRRTCGYYADITLVAEPFNEPGNMFAYSFGRRAVRARRTQLAARLLLNRHFDSTRDYY